MHFRNLALLIFLGILIAGAVQAQVAGCTDCKAGNYDPAATVNDGSCRYRKIRIRLKNGHHLSPAIVESSGLLWLNGNLVTHNDGGHGPVLYFLRPETGEILRQVIISGATNTDWEAITLDDSFVYIGDFGNNYGDRKNLTIYKINQKDLLSQKNIVPVSKKYSFSYAGQKDFSARFKQNFDCEAFIVKDDTFWLFTKNRTNAYTNVYGLPVSGHENKAQLIDSFQMKGAVTSAMFDNYTQTLYLLAYKNFKPFIRLFYHFPGNYFFGGYSRLIKLRNREQTESLCKYGSSFFLTTEKSLFGTNKLYKIEFPELLIKD